LPRTASDRNHAAMVRIIVVRHCESEANRGGPEMGGANSPLSARGRAQALTVSEAIAGLGLVAPLLLSSPLDRAADTARAIDQALGVGVVFDPRLSAGETVMARDLALTAPTTVLAVGAEILQALAERLDGGAETLVAVGHRYTIWALLTVLLGDIETAKAVHLANGDHLDFILENGALVAAPTHHRLAPLAA